MLLDAKKNMSRVHRVQVETAPPRVCAAEGGAASRAVTAARTERRAAHHHRLCVSRPHSASDTTQHQPPLSIRISAAEEDQEHILISASIPQLPAIACAPPTPGVFVHGLLFYITAVIWTTFFVASTFSEMVLCFSRAL